MEGGAHAYCLDRQPKPSKAFLNTRDRLAHHFQGTLHYRQVDVLHETTLNDVMSAVAAKHGRMDGLIAAAAMQHVQAALDIPAEKITEMMDTNFRGVLFSARSCARQMIKYKTPGSIVLIGSMSGLNANKGFDSCVYNGSKAAVIQLGRNLAMEVEDSAHVHCRTRIANLQLVGPCCRRQSDSCECVESWQHHDAGNAVCTRCRAVQVADTFNQMVENDFRNDPKLREIWEKANMLGRISETHEYRGAALFMLSDASSFMTGANVVIDGGYTAW